MKRIIFVALILGCGEGRVRSLHNSYVTTCTGGINQQAELAVVADTATPSGRVARGECADARNVWAPDGKVVERPGYVGIGRFINTTSGNSVTLYGRTEDTSAGTFASPVGGLLTLSGLVSRVTSAGDMDRWYAGYDSTFSGVLMNVDTLNTAATQFKAEYWNGSAWTYLRVVEQNTDFTGAAKHVGQNGDAWFIFAQPQDWATTTVDGQAAYWLRFNLLSANVSVNTAIFVSGAETLNGGNPKGMFPVQFPSTKRYLMVAPVTSLATTLYVNSSTVDLRVFSQLSVAPNIDGEPATIAIVPQFEEAFISYGYRVSRHTTSSNALADVETGDFAVGELPTPAPYAPSQVVTLGEFPQAKYISFFGGRLWAANLYDNKFAVRWSAAAPFHKVWPEGAIEVVAEHDNSPITGMQPLGEYMVIYKSDSIWMAYPVGPDETTLVESFSIQQVVAGIGCVSNSSIKSIRGNHIFLAEDGIYKFDGNSVEKLSDNLNDTINAITPGRRPFSAAAHWKKHNLYLLSITTDGSNTSNLTVVYDYKNGTWWLWDNIDAQHWLEDEAANDNEVLYFGDSSGRIYEMGGQNDHGAAIDSYVLTQRFAYGGSATTRVHAIEAWCSNEARSITLDVLTNDDDTATATGTMSFTDTAENDWDDFSYASGATTDDSWNALRRRVKRLNFREDCDWFQVKVSHSEKNQKFELSKLAIASSELGVR